MQLLHIDSSILGSQSVSRQLTASIVARLAEARQDVAVTYRDVAVTPVPQLSPGLQFAKLKAAYQAGALSGATAEDVATALKAGAGADAKAASDFAAANAALDEFLTAEIAVIGAPMYNFGIPSQLKAWIDCLVVAGRTFRYTPTGAEGLAGGKRVIIASSRGGVYSAGSPFAAMDHQESYLKGVFSFLGITDIAVVRAEGVSMGADQRQRALEAALAGIGTLRAA